MSCIWNLFRKKKKVPAQPLTHPDSTVQNPLNLDEIPNDITTLRLVEQTIIDKLISTHYKLEQTKENIRYTLQRGNSQRLKETLGKRAVLTERKRMLETRLASIQARLEEMKNPK